MKNFSGECVDENTAYEFAYDFDAQQQATEKTKTLVLVSLAVLPVYAVNLVYALWYVHRKWELIELNEEKT